MSMIDQAARPIVRSLICFVRCLQLHIDVANSTTWIPFWREMAQDVQHQHVFLLFCGASSMSTASNLSVAVCLLLADAISRAETLDDIYTIALDALANGLNVSRAPSCSSITMVWCASRRRVGCQTPANGRSKVTPRGEPIVPIPNRSSFATCR